MKVDDPCMADNPCQARNYFLACYAVSLIQGQTILGKTVRSRTVANYLKDAYTLFKNRRITFLPVLDTDYIQLIIGTLRKYENVADRRNMITDGMMHWLLQEVSKRPQDNELSSIMDWVVLGRYTGFRKSEWCQSSQSTYESIKEWPGKPPLAFIITDITYLDKNERRLPRGANQRDIHYVRLVWRKQKNDENGEAITFARDTDNPSFCPVLATIRIIERATRLRVPAHEPIAVFKHKNGKRRFITDTLVSTYFRLAATAVLGIKKGDKDLQLWSTHSIRVTAANLLHRERFADSFIMKRLRWRSLAFMDYLRNTIYAAEQHACLKISDSNLPPLVERSYRIDEPHEAVVAAAA